MKRRTSRTISSLGGLTGTRLRTEKCNHRTSHLVYVVLVVLSCVYGHGIQYNVRILLCFVYILLITCIFDYFFSDSNVFSKFIYLKKTLLVLLMHLLTRYKSQQNTEIAQRCQQLRQGVHHRGTQAHTHRQALHHESRPNRIFRILLRQSRVHRDSLKRVLDR